MPTGLIRLHSTGHLHFITCSCFRHRQLLGTPEARDTFVKILEQTRSLHEAEIRGYVIMPDHIHLLMREPPVKKLSTFMQVVKQRFSKTREESEVWEIRYHDFNVRTDAKRIEKLRYIHRNPVKRGLVENPEDWPWSSYTFYASQHPNPVQITI